MTNPFPNLNVCIHLFHHMLYNRCDYLFMLELKLIHVSKWAPDVWGKYDCLFWLIDGW